MVTELNVRLIITLLGASALKACKATHLSAVNLLAASKTMIVTNVSVVIMPRSNVSSFARVEPVLKALNVMLEITKNSALAVPHLKEMDMSTVKDVCNQRAYLNLGLF